MTHFTPGTESELSEIVQWAGAEGGPFELVAGASKRALGRPLQVGHTLDLSRFCGIEAYEAAELVLTAGAATALAEIEAALAAENQMLAFEPPGWLDLMGANGARPTLGGVVATNLSGPRRIRAGAARDHFLGVTGVNGRGEAFKAGGRVVKNVTGYDLCKLLAGSYGTLAAMTTVTLKVLPRPETTRTVAARGLDDAAAIRLLAAALASPHEVSGAAHLPAGPGRDTALTLLRVEGPGPSVAYRAESLLPMAAGAEILDEAASLALWRDLAEIVPVLPFDPAVEALWRLSVVPTAAPALVGRIAAAAGRVRHVYDWGGGLVWLVVPAPLGDDAGAALVRQAIAAEGGGHATLIRAPDPVRAAVPVFEPLPQGLAALNRRVKDSFDPLGLFNPGRLA